MLYPYTTRASLRYSPKKLHSVNPNNWWLVLDCDTDIGDYYRNLVYIGMWRTVSINRMYWDCHVTVVRNEEPPEDKKVLWGKYEGEILEIRYSPEVQTNGLFYWLSVECERLFEIREELGLPRQPEYPFHITIGNVK